MGGPRILCRHGRVDSASGEKCPPSVRLPDAAIDHIRAVFYRMRFSDEEIVPLIGGGHALGRCHTDRSSYTGPWTFAPTTFSNEFYRLLVEEKWTPKKWNGPLQYEDSSKELMMLPTDREMINNPDFAKYTKVFALKIKIFFFEVFSKAWTKLMELGTDLCAK